MLGAAKTLVALEHAAGTEDIMEPTARMMARIPVGVITPRTSSQRRSPPSIRRLCIETIATHHFQLC